LFPFSKIKSSSSTLAAIKNASWLIGEKLFSMLLVLLISIMIARHLGPDSFGMLNYLLAIVALMAPFCALGFNAIITREIVKDTDRQNIIMSTALAFRFIGGGVAALFLFFIYSLGILSKLESSLGWLVLLSIVNIFTALHVIDFWFQAKVLSRYVVKARLIAMLMSSGVKVVLVINNAELNAFVWAAAFESLLISLSFLSIYLYKANFFRVNDIDWQYGFALLKQSKWLVISGIASIIYLKIDQLMLAEMVSVTEVGIYSVASRMSEVWYFFPTAVVASFFPSLLKLKEENEQKYQVRLQKLCDFLFVFALILAICLTFLADWLIIFLFGRDYSAAGFILSLHIWAGLFVFMRALLSKWLLAEHLVFFSFVTHGVGAVINVTLNLWLIPLYQGVGAAVATVISYAFASYIVLFFHHSTRPMAIIMTKSLLFPVRLIMGKIKL